MPFEIGAEELDELYRRHAKPMLRFFVRTSFDAQLGLDVVGETFARAWANRRTFHGNTQEAATAWLWTIGRNALNDALRRGACERRALAKLAVMVPRLDDEEMERVESLAGLPELRRNLRDVLSQLAPNERTVLHLRIVMELDYKEIANRLGTSSGAARVRVHRAIRALSELMETADGSYESRP